MDETQERPDEPKGREQRKINRKKKSDLAVRVRSACFMLPLLLFLWLGGWWLFLLVVFCAALAMREFYNGYEHMGVRPAHGIGYASLILYALCCLLAGRYGYGAIAFGKKCIVSYSQLVLLWLFITMALALGCAIFDKRDDHSIESGPVGALGALYIGFLMFHVYLLRCLPSGRLLVWLTFLISIGTDTTAYSVGRHLGKYTKKMAPAISPKKSMAGFWGGMIGGTLFCVLYALIFKRSMLGHFALMGFIGSFFSQGGDLIESAFKRKWGVKDSSNLIPGHGGVLDRLDSAMFTSSFVYYYSIFILSRGRV